MDEVSDARVLRYVATSSFVKPLRHGQMYVRVTTKRGGLVRGAIEAKPA